MLKKYLLCWCLLNLVDRIRFFAKLGFQLSSELSHHGGRVGELERSLLPGGAQEGVLETVALSQEVLLGNGGDQLGHFCNDAFLRQLWKIKSTSLSKLFSLEKKREKREENKKKEKKEEGMTDMSHG